MFSCLKCPMGNNEEQESYSEGFRFHHKYGRARFGTNYTQMQSGTGKSFIAKQSCPWYSVEPKAQGTTHTVLDPEN